MSQRREVIYICENCRREEEEIERTQGWDVPPGWVQLVAPADDTLQLGPSRIQEFCSWECVMDWSSMQFAQEEIDKHRRGE